MSLSSENPWEISRLNFNNHFGFLLGIYLVDGLNPFEKKSPNWIISANRGENKHVKTTPPNT